MIHARELGQILRFGAVGGFATATHLVIVAFLVRTTELQPFAMHCSGYLVAFMISFFGHYHVTFNSKKAYRTAIRKFLLVSFGIFAASSLVVSLADGMGLSRGVSLFLAAVSVPIFSYIMNKKYVY